MRVEDEEKVSFDRSGALTGARQAAGIALSVFSYGLVFGVLAREAGLSVLESLLMSGLVFAGAAQFVVLGLWTLPLPIGPIVLTTLVVNLRHLLMGAALSPWFLRLPRLQAYSTLFFMTDENWALTMGEFGKGRRNAAFLLGSGVMLLLAWTGATVAGRALGGVLQDPSQFGLDFAFTAVFLALLVGLWRGRGDIVPWVVAAIVALAAWHWLPGKWYILLGGLAGSAVGARQADGDHDAD